MLNKYSCVHLKSIALFTIYYQYNLNTCNMMMYVCQINYAFPDHHNSCPSTCRMANPAVPMTDTADGDAVSRCQVLGRAGSVHHGGRCLMPLSQVSGSFTYTHLSMFTLDRQTCLRNRLSAFQVVHGFYAPAGRCSSALMLGVHTGVQGIKSFAPQLHASSFRHRLDGFSAFDTILPRFQA